MSVMVTELYLEETEKLMSERAGLSPLTIVQIIVAAALLLLAVYQWISRGACC